MVAQTKLDQVQHRYLLKGPATVDLDQVQQRYLLQVPSVPDTLLYTRNPHSYFIKALNENNPIPIKEQYITFHTPVTIVGGRFNTKIELTVDRKSGYHGSKTMHYNRNPLGHIVIGRDLFETFKPKISDLNTTRDLLAAFNVHFGTVIPVSEIQDEPMGATGEPTWFTAAEDSFLFTPGTRVEMGIYSGADRYTDLPTTTFLFNNNVLGRMWTAGIDYSYADKLPVSGTLVSQPGLDTFVEQYFDDPADAPSSTHYDLRSRSITEYPSTNANVSSITRQDRSTAASTTRADTNVVIVMPFDKRRV